MTEAKSFKDIIQDHLKSNRIPLPVFNKIAFDIQRETARSEPDINRIRKLIEKDQALTTQFIKMANTAFFRGLAKVATVQDAIVRLGTQQVSAIVILVTQKGNFRSDDPYVNKFMTKLWRHSVGTALGSGWLARRCGYPQLSDQAFVAGLLHDVGKLFLLSVVELIRRDPKTTFKPSPEFMNEIMETLHTEQGYMLMEKWNLPEAYWEVTRDHHNEEVAANRTLLLIVQMADATCNKMGIGFWEPSDLILAAMPVAQLLNLSEVDLAELEIALEDAEALTA